MQYLLCQWDHTFYLTCWKTVWICSDGETIIFGSVLFAITKELRYLAERNASLHFTVNVPYGQRLKKKKSSLCSLTGIFGTSSHHCQPLNVLVPSFWYFPHRMSCMWVLNLTVLLAKLPFWLDIIWTLTQCGEFCDHLTSLINKSSVAK